MIYVKVNGTEYPANIVGRVADRDWDNRESKAITLEMDYETASTLFVDGLAWSIVQQNEIPICETDANGEYVLDENGEPIQTATEVQATEYDNSAYNLVGDITVHRDGTLTVKMGKLTDLEEAYELLLGGAES